MTFGGGNLRGQNIPVAWQNRSQLTAENSGRSNSQLIFKSVERPYFTKDGLVRLFSIYARPHQLSYLRPSLTLRQIRVMKWPTQMPDLNLM
jgi:hypothetical protein